MGAYILALLELDENSRQVVKSLEAMSSRVVVCKTFIEAVRLLQHDAAALIISDVHLENGGTVFDFLKWVRSNPVTRETPFVMFSCSPTEFALHVEDGVRTTARILGATMYITMKEFDATDFSQRIGSLLSKPVEEKQADKTI